MSARWTHGKVTPQLLLVPRHRNANSLSKIRYITWYHISDWFDIARFKRYFPLESKLFSYRSEHQMSSWRYARLITKAKQEWYWSGYNSSYCNKTIGRVASDCWFNSFLNEIDWQSSASLYFCLKRTTKAKLPTFKRYYLRQTHGWISRKSSSSRSEPNTHSW